MVAQNRASSTGNRKYVTVTTHAGRHRRTAPMAPPAKLR